jgi:hypothetical protein
MCPVLWDEFVRENAEIRNRVYQESTFTGLVHDEEAAGGQLADMYRL